MNPNEKWEPESPFLETPNYETELLELQVPNELGYLETPWIVGESPFARDEYEYENAEQAQSDSVKELLTEFYDAEFEESVYQLISEASNHLDDRFTGELGDTEAQLDEAERELQQYFAPLVYEAEQMYSHFTSEIERQDLSNINEVELELFLDQRFPAPSGQLQPEFEEFLGKLLNKAKGLVKGAVNLAQKGVGAITGKLLAPLLGRLKSFVRPLIDRVIKYAINRLPQKVRPIAQKLAKTLVGTTLGEFEFEEQSFSNAYTIESLQQEYDFLLSELLLSPETQFEYSISEFQEYETITSDPNVTISQAREEFVKAFSHMEKGQNPQPIVEEFAPAILYAIKFLVPKVIKLIGRPKVVNFLAGLVAKLIEKWIGTESARALATSLVDVGLRLFGAEATNVDPRAITAEIVAETVEQTFVQLAQLPEYAFEDETLLEAYTLEAFEQAASASFPDSMIKTELRETARLNGVWSAMPNRKRKKFYRKFSVVSEIEISPQIAKSIKTYGGASIQDYFNDVLMLNPSKPIRARMHLYEMKPGTRLSDIVRHEKIPGMSVWHLHPLTPHNANSLLREPKIGKAVKGRGLYSPYYPALGQRYFYLEILGAMQAAPLRYKSQKPCVNRTYITLNASKETIVIKMHIGEKTAQEISQSLKRRDYAGAWRIFKNSREGIEEMLKSPGQNFQLIGFELEDYSNMEGEEFLGGITNTLGKAWNLTKSAFTGILLPLGKWLIETIWQAISNYFKTRAEEFIRATASPENGVTLTVTFSKVQALRQLRNLKRGNLSNLSLDSLKSLPNVSYTVAAGCR